MVFKSSGCTNPACAARERALTENIYLLRQQLTESLENQAQLFQLAGVNINEDLPS